MFILGARMYLLGSKKAMARTYRFSNREVSKYITQTCRSSQNRSHAKERLDGTILILSETQSLPKEARWPPHWLYKWYWMSSQIEPNTEAKPLQVDRRSRILLLVTWSGHLLGNGMQNELS